jgi:hypothetical protein
MYSITISEQQAINKTTNGLIFKELPLSRSD